MIWTNSKCETLFYDARDAWVDMPCSVEIDGNRIRVWYAEEDENGNPGVTTYSGTENGAGHYVLLASEKNGEATLHRFEDSDILEGYWMEQTTRGMWRIKLGDS